MDWHTYESLQANLSKKVSPGACSRDISFSGAILAAKSMLHAEKNREDSVEEILDDLLVNLRSKLRYVNPRPTSRSARKTADCNEAYNDGIRYAMSVFEKARKRYG